MTTGSRISRAVLAVLTVLSLAAPAPAAHFPDPPYAGSSPFAMWLYGTASVGGVPLGPGDEVAVFSVHPRPNAPRQWERLLVGRADVGPGGEFGIMAVVGDDPDTAGLVEGASFGEGLLLAAWSGSEGREYVTYGTPAGDPLAVTWGGDLTEAQVEADFFEGQAVPLRTNAWNLVSFASLAGWYRGALPSAPQLPGVAWTAVESLDNAAPLRSIAGKYDRITSQDGTGAKVFNPSLPQFSTLSYLAPGYGYWVKMKNDPSPLAWMTVPGPRARGDEPLALNGGWTLAGYWGLPVYHEAASVPSLELFPPDAQDNVLLPRIGAAFGALGENLLRATTFDGSGAKLWNPALPQFSTMRYLGPGYGTWLRLATPATLYYPPYTPPPAGPTGVSAAAGDGRVTVSWSPLAGADSYNLYWSTSPAVGPGTGSRIAGVSSPHTLTGAVNGIPLYFVVTGTVGGVESAASATVSATPAEGAGVRPPAAPQGVAAEAGVGQVTVSWSPVDNANSYTLYWSTRPGVSAATANRVVGAASPFVHEGLSALATFHYAVAAEGPGGEGALSAEVSATTLPAGSLPTAARFAGGAPAANPNYPDAEPNRFAGEPGAADGGPAEARFNRPTGITTDNAYLYVADAGNQTVRRVSLDNGSVVTFAGAAGVQDNTDGPHLDARFRSPQGATVLGGALYVVEADNHMVRRIDLATGVVERFAGFYDAAVPDGDFVCGANRLDCRFSYPHAITTDGVDLYIADSNSAIRKIDMAHDNGSTIAGGPPVPNPDYPADSLQPNVGQPGYVNGVGTASRFDQPHGLCSDGANLYVADTANHAIRKVVLATGEVTTLAGGLPVETSPGVFRGQPGYADGTGTAARFRNPERLVTDGVNLYVADARNHAVRQVSIATGAVTTLAGGRPVPNPAYDPSDPTNPDASQFFGSPDYVDGAGAAARFNVPTGITLAGRTLYVTDRDNHAIRTVTLP